MRHPQITTVTTLAILLSACATPQQSNPPQTLFTSETLKDELIEMETPMQNFQTCILKVRLKNLSGTEQNPEFRMLLLDDSQNTLQESSIKFPTVLSQREFIGAKYIYELPCTRIKKVQLSSKKN